jgi:hypothetical protein
LLHDRPNNAQIAAQFNLDAARQPHSRRGLMGRSYFDGLKRGR